MAGSLHPPFSLFLPEGKEKTGRARSKREKEVCALRGTGDEGTRKACLRFLRMSPVRGVVRAGVLEVIEWTSFSFRCRLSGAGRKLPKDGGQRSVAAHLVRIEKEVR